MKFGTVCRRCEQAQSGCGFSASGEDSGRELQGWEETALATTVCLHALCLSGQEAICTVLSGGHHPHCVRTDGKLAFKFRGKEQAFVVDPILREVLQEEGGDLITIGLHV